MIQPRHETVTTIDLLRHGECVGGDIFRGKTDKHLSVKGRQQMDAVAQAAETEAGWQRIISSPLVRCSRFAASLSQRLGLPVHTEAGFSEISFGDWEGRAVKEVWKNDAKNVARFFLKPSRYPPPNGETIAAFEQRLMLAWEAILSRHAGENLLLVTHGGVIRVLLCSILQMPLDGILRIEVPFASLSRIRVYHEGDILRPMMVFHNAYGDAVVE